MNPYLVVVPGAVVLATVLWSWALHIRQQKRIEVLEGRLANLLAGLSLLTDTTESGLREVTVEMSRLTVGEAGQMPHLSFQQRIAGAASRGKSIQEIAAAAQMSEGEVMLRLSMTRAQEAAHAALR